MLLKHFEKLTFQIGREREEWRNERSLIVLHSHWITEVCRDKWTEQKEKKDTNSWEDDCHVTHFLLHLDLSFSLVYHALSLSYTHTVFEDEDDSQVLTWEEWHMRSAVSLCLHYRSLTHTTAHTIHSHNMHILTATYTL